MLCCVAHTAANERGREIGVSQSARQSIWLGGERAYPERKKEEEEEEQYPPSDQGGKNRRMTMSKTLSRCFLIPFLPISVSFGVSRGHAGHTFIFSFFMRTTCESLPPPSRSPISRRRFERADTDARFPHFASPLYYLSISFYNAHQYFLSFLVRTLTMKKRG